MKTLLDVNVWLALSLKKHPQHKSARAWYRRVPLKRGDLLLCRQTEMGFLRLVTHRSVMAHCGLEPLTNREAVSFLNRVCQDEAVRRCEEPPGTRALWLELAQADRPSPHAWMDAYLVALSITLEANFVTFDQGIARFTDRGVPIEVLDPE